MANSKYEYVKSFEVDNEILLPNLIIVKIDGSDFTRFSKVHGLERPNDERALNLMNSCATSVLAEYSDVVFCYGFSDEYSFVFKKTTKFYKRRSSKILSIIISFFSSAYTTKWGQFFPKIELRYPPSFRGRVISCSSISVLQKYLAWRQYECHVSNLYNTCFWMLIKSGITELNVREILKDSRKQDKNEILFQQFGIIYKRLNPMFRQGSCIFMIEGEDIVKYHESGYPVKRLRTKVIEIHTEKITGKNFWNQHPTLVRELGHFSEDSGKYDLHHIRAFLLETKLMPSTWIIIRIDGCHFHRFSEEHEFEKPNDEQALNLMNSCASSILEEFRDVVFSYGVSDEYSFVLKKDSHFFHRKTSDIVSSIVSFFTSIFVMKWKSFFPHKELQYPPYFDGRAVCYPSVEILLDYLAWRQADCHINNQYNTCFWMLVKSGKSKVEAQHMLKGTQARQKNDLLAEQFGIDYYTLKDIFRLGSSIYKQASVSECGDGASGGTPEYKIIIEHCNIIEHGFWEAHPYILG